MNITSIETILKAHMQGAEAVITPRELTLHLIKEIILIEENINDTSLNVQDKAVRLKGLADLILEGLYKFNIQLAQCCPKGKDGEICEYCKQENKDYQDQTDQRGAASQPKCYYCGVYRPLEELKTYSNIPDIGPQLFCIDNVCAAYENMKHSE